MRQVSITEFRKMGAEAIQDALPCELTSDGEAFALLLPNCNVGMTPRILALADMGKVPRKSRKEE